MASATPATNVPYRSASLTEAMGMWGCLLLCCVAGSGRHSEQSPETARSMHPKAPRSPGRHAGEDIHQAQDVTSEQCPGPAETWDAYWSWWRTHEAVPADRRSPPS